MHPQATPSTLNYLIGKGILSIARITNSVIGAYVDVGNCPKFTFEPTAQVAEHYSSRQAQKELDGETVIMTGGNIAFTLDEFSLENLRMFLLATKTAGGVLQGVRSPNEYYSVKFISDNTSGPDYDYYFWKVKITPTGALNLISDEFDTLEFTGKVFSDRSNHPDSPFYDVVPDGATTTTTTTSTTTTTT